MKGIETRLTKLEQARPDDDFVRLPDDLSLWTEEHWKGLAQWFDRDDCPQPLKDRRGFIVDPPSPLDDLSPYTLKALVSALVETQEIGEGPTSVTDW